MYNKHCGIVRAKKIVKEGDLKRIHDRAIVAPPLTLPILSHPVCLGCIFVVFLVFFFLKPKIKWAWSTLLTACLRYGGGRVFSKGLDPIFRDGTPVEGRRRQIIMHSYQRHHNKFLTANKSCGPSFHYVLNPNPCIHT